MHCVLLILTIRVCSMIKIEACLSFTNLCYHLRWNKAFFAICFLFFFLIFFFKKQKDKASSFILPKFWCFTYWIFPVTETLSNIILFRRPKKIQTCPSKENNYIFGNSKSLMLRIMNFQIECSYKIFRCLIPALFHFHPFGSQIPTRTYSRK